MSISEELNKIIASKEAIRQSIIAKGTDVDTNVPFSDYASKIDEIETSSGEEYKFPEFYELRTDSETSFKGLFYCSTYTGDLDLSGLDVSKTTDMSHMFNECSASNIVASNWDTKNVTNTERMFCYYKGGIDISNLNFDNVSKCDYMFAYASLDKIKGIMDRNPVPNCKNLAYMFSNANYTGELDFSNWDISNVTKLNNIFNSLSCKKLDLTNWNTANVTDMSTMFGFAYNDNSPEALIIPDWIIADKTSTSNLFGYSEMYTRKLYYIDLSRSNDTTISIIASRLYAKTESTPGTIVIPSDTSQDVIDALAAKYWKPVGPKLDLVSCEITAELDEVLLGNTTKICVGNCNPWYGDTENNFEFVVANDSVASIDKDGVLTTHSLGSTEIYAILKDSKAIISNTITVTVSETDSSPYIVKFKGTASPMDLCKIIVNGTTVNLSSIDYNSISGVYTYDVGEPITSIVFNGADAIAYGNTCTDLVKLNTDSITSMERMFKNCHISSLDVPKFNTSNVTNMSSMFNSCSSLTSIKGDLDLSKCRSVGSMFTECYNLEEVSLVNIFKDSTPVGLAHHVSWSIRLEDTKVKDECIVSIISELPNLYDKGYANKNITLMLPPTNTLTADQVQPAIDKGWIVGNVNSNVIDEASTFSLRKPVIPDRVYKLVENENGLYQSQDGTRYDILEANIVLSSEGINVGWDTYKDLNQAIEGFNVIRIEVPIEPEEETVTNNDEEIARCESEIEVLQDAIVQLQARIDELQNK